MFFLLVSFLTVSLINGMTGLSMSLHFVTVPAGKSIFCFSLFQLGHSSVLSAR